MIGERICEKMKISIFENGEQVEYVELPGDVSDYDITINSSSPTEFPVEGVDDEAPEVPEVPLEDIDAKSNEDAYLRMKNNPDALPSEIRGFIYQNNLITRKNLDDWLSQQGYSKRSGTVRESLIVLEEITEEVRRVGSDDEMHIVWVGQD